MTAFRVVLADGIHIHSRNFPTLFRFLEDVAAEVSVHDRHDDMKRALGDYTEFRERLAPYRAHLQALTPNELWHATHLLKTTPVRLWEMSRSEFLACSLARHEEWHFGDGRRPSDRELFERGLRLDRDTLVDNLAAAAFWIDALGPVVDGGAPTHALVFSGSMTYARVLMEICKFARTRVFVLETTFTGNEYYFEERYTPIANSSDIRHPTIRASLPLPADATERLRIVAKALQRMAMARNKNVTQPATADLPRFPDPARPTLLVVGQVVNDFSVIETKDRWLSTIAFYRELIVRCLRETEYNIIFKAHPWEHRKAHVGRALTREHLERAFETLPAELRERVAIRENDNLRVLGDASDRVALLCSQAGVELALECGLRPSTFGSPYFGAAGFTDEYVSIEEFIADVRSGRSRALLDLAGVDALHEFLAKFLQLHVVTVRSSGTSDLRQKFVGRSEIRLSAPRRPATRGASRPPPDDSVLGRAQRKLRKLRRDPKGFFRDAKIVRVLRGGL